ncbi:MAG TPA: PAS domain S-box protein [Dissulfurispiraceae bacterium]|nr:PAS domain S-box protein [Dissulfurispiraceae bacterium]
MTRKLIIILVSLVSITCVVLFQAFYNGARQSAIEKLNEEQLIYARQASNGIQEYFSTWGGILASFAKMNDVIDVTADGRHDMQLLYESHQKQIRSITRVDENGIIMHTAPESSFIGSNISGQKHIQEILATHKPVVSDVFRTIQGAEAIALHVPVFKGTAFKGSIAVVVNFESLSKRYLDVIRIGQTGHVWVISRDGTQLYSDTPERTGKAVLESYREYPTILAMAHKMLQGDTGAATYVFGKSEVGSSDPDRYYAVYMPARLENTFWSIAVSSNEKEVLAGLTSFRNRLAIVLGFVFVGGTVLSAYGARAWFIIHAERKRREVEAALQQSEMRYRNLFERNPAPMFIYQRGELRLLAVNDAFLHHYGYTAEEALALRLTDLYPDEEKERIAKFATGLKGHAYAGEWHHLKADGSMIDIVATSHDIDYWGRDARIAVITDITARKRAEDALRQSEEKFFKAFHATPDAIIISRASDGLIIEANEVFLQQTGYSRDEAMGMSTVAHGLWASPDDRARYVEGIKTHGRVREMEAGFRTKAGAVLDGLVSGEGIVLNGVTCMLTIIRNITERKKTERELAKYREHLEEMVGVRTDELQRSQAALKKLLDDMNAANTELAKANEKLMEVDLLKSMFIASMSHELRTPLNSIIGFSSILLHGWRGQLNDEQREDLGIINRAGKHLLALINDVIDVSKIEAGKLDSRIEAFDVAGVIHEAVEFHRRDIEQKGLDLRVVAEPCSIHTDRRRLLQSVMNLISNAVKFTEKGAIEIRSGEYVDGAMKYVEIAVGDTGIGIKQEDMPKLFSSFMRIDSPLRAVVPGTGLGLYLTRKLVADILKGSLTAESRYGEGSTFIIRVPNR